MLKCSFFNFVLFKINVCSNIIWCCVDLFLHFIFYVQCPPYTIDRFRSTYVCCIDQHFFMGGLGQTTLLNMYGFSGSLMATTPSNVINLIPLHAHSNALALPITCLGPFDSLPVHFVLKSSTTVTLWFDINC
jgi:hypothetical protein